MKTLKILLTFLLLFAIIVLPACNGDSDPLDNEKENEGNIPSDSDADNLPSDNEGDGPSDNEGGDANTPSDDENGGGSSESDKLKASEGLDYYWGVGGIYIKGIGSCTDLDVVIPSEIDGKPVVGIEREAFYLSDIESVVIPGSVYRIDDYAFAECYCLMTVTIEEGVETIGDRVFCPMLESITLPTTIKSIGSNCFPEEYTVITYRGTAEAWERIDIDYEGNEAFFGEMNFLGLAGPAIEPDDSEQGGSSDEPKDPIIESLQTFFYEVENESEKTCYITSIKDLGGSTDVVVPNKIDGYTVIWCMDGAFSNDKNLDSIATAITSVKIPNTVTYIGSRAFAGCTKLTKVEIPNSVTEIGGQAFADCPALTSVTIPGSIKVIPEKLFLNCAALSRITFGEGVEIIEDYAISGCKRLYEWRVPSSVIEFGHNVLSGSDFVQQGKIYYSGSKAKWQSISAGRDNWFISSSRVVCNG